MNEFWLWFWRPLAEFLGAIAFIVIAAVIAFIGLCLYVIYNDVADKLWRKKS